MRFPSKHLLLLVLLLAFALRFYHLDERALGTDETWSLRFTEQLATGTFFENVGTHAHPPFFYALMVPFWLVSDHSLYFLRFIMVLFGLLSIYLTYLLGQKAFSERVGLLSSLLLALSPFHLIYSQQFRPYIFLMCLFVLSLLLLFSYLKTKKTTPLVLLALVGVLSFYSHVFAAFFVAAEFILLAVASSFKVIKIKLLPILLAGGVTAASWLLWLPAFMQQYHYNITQGALVALTKFKFIYFPYTFYKFVMGLDYSAAWQLGYWFVPVWAFALLLFLFYACYHYRKHSFVKSYFLVSLLFLPMFLMAFVGLFAPIYSFRYLSYLTPLFFLLLAYGFTLIRHKYLRYTALFVTLLIWTMILLFYWSVIDDRIWNVHFGV